MTRGLNPTIWRCLDGNGGAAAWSELVTASSRGAVEWAVQAGLLRRIFPQVLIEHDRAQDAEVRIRAALLWARRAEPGAAVHPRVTGPSALAMWRLPVPEGHPVYLEVAHGSALHAPEGIVLHRLQHRGAAWRRAGVVFVSLERAIVSSWPVMPGDARRALVFQATRTGRTTTARLLAELGTWPRLRGRGGLLSLLALIDDGCESELEFVARTQVFAGPEFNGIDWQHRVEENGRRFRLDGYHEASRTAIELDGDAYHSTREQRRYDDWRTRWLAERDIRVVRFHHDEIMDSPEVCRRQLLAILSARRAGGATVVRMTRR